MHNLTSFYLSTYQINKKLIQKYPHIIESYLYFINICYDILLLYFILIMIFFNSFWNVFNSKTFKECYILSIHIQSYPLSSYCLLLNKIYYICPIFYFRKNISSINTIKFRFILEIFFVF